MKLLHVRGEFFRNIRSLDITLSPHLNVFYGGNGSGKSTVLEMIYCLSRGRSFRTHLASPIIQYQQNYCTIFGKLCADNFSTSIGFRKNKHGKTELRIGHDKQPPTNKALSQLLPIQLFHPESHDFLNDGPSLRRKFIDWGLFYTEVGFIELWHRFHQALKQRNAALAQRQPAAYISSWDVELASTGEQLSQLRSDYIDQLMHVAKNWIIQLLGVLPVTLSYYAGWDIHQPFLSLLKDNLDKDLKYGYTSAGPHRFDLLLRSNGLPAEAVFSRGEQKRLICALYLAQGQIFKQRTKKGCLYLLDDILSELDALYQSKVLDALMMLDSQVVVTSLDINQVQPLFGATDCKRFHLVDGAVT
jgi:DNA replication and repair protein RecF